MKHDDILSKASALIAIIKGRFISPSGFISSNWPPTDRTLFDHFDDLVPFFLYFGEADFLLTQVSLAAERHETLPSLLAHNGVLEARYIDEWLGGLYTLWQQTRDHVVKKMLDDSVAFILSHFMCDDGNLYAAIRTTDGRPRRYWESWSAGLLEVFGEMHADYPEAYEKARRILQSWIQHEYVKEHGIFPYRVFDSPIRSFLQRTVLSRVHKHYFEGEPSGFDNLSPGGWLRRADWYARNGWYSFLMKSNSTPAFTLLHYYLIDHEKEWLSALESWVAAALDHFREGGTVFMEWFPSGNVRRNPSEVAAFILCDVICDSAYWIPMFRSRLPIVKEILDTQLSTLCPNALVPHSGQLCRAHIDTQVDFSVTMRRYAELSGESAYFERAGSLMRTALAEHESPDGYRTFSGSAASSVVDPKYNALVLKGMINLLTIDRPLYPELHSLFKDR